MQSLAAGVGDLKRVLTNVTRGTWGEVQLGALLEQILAPDQYSQNVGTSGTGERVEFAIKLPGRDGLGSPVWLPIDAKFPVEDYHRLVDASDKGDVDAIDKAHPTVGVHSQEWCQDAQRKVHLPAVHDRFWDPVPVY